jgi:TRAP-type C4-dicarboxylate transport system permease small subunit
MTPGFGIGMFFLGMGCIIIGTVMAFFIIRQVMKELHQKKKPTRFDDLE